MKIKIKDIIVNKRLRRIGNEQVKKLSDSIIMIGLINPIVVDNKNNLVAGNHRLEACKLLGWTEIEASVVTLDDVHKQLIEIDENLIRHNLDMIEKGNHLIRRKEVFGQLNITMDDYVASESFIKDTASKLGVGEQTVRDDLKIAEGLNSEIKEMISENPNIMTKSLALDLSKQPEDIQKRFMQNIFEAPRSTPEDIKRKAVEMGIVVKKSNPLYSFLCKCGEKYIINFRTQEVINKNNDPIALKEE